MRILVVDDSMMMRRIIMKFLREAGYTEILEAPGGIEAMRMLRGVGLVLTDWNMPGMDGLALVQEIRRDPRYQSLPIIMVTTEGAKEEVIEALRSGVNEYIVKPFTREVLVGKIAHAMQTAVEDPIDGR